MRLIRIRPIIFLAIALSTFPVLGDWPAFLGGTSRNAQRADVPTSWDSSTPKWTTPLAGYGQSSPVVVGENVYLTAIDGPQKETDIVMCIDLKSGEQKWQHTLKNSLLAKNDPYTSRAAPSPVADANGIYAFFEGGEIVALSPTGEVRWQRSLMEDYSKYEGRFGLGGSLAQLDDRLFVLADNEGPSYLLAIDKATGKSLWKTDRDSRTSWSSPMMIAVDGEPQIVVSSAGSLDGYEPATGELLWTSSDVGGNTVASPFPFGEASFLVGASPGRNGENSDGAKRSNMAVRIVKDGDSFKPEILWRNEKATSSFGSPIVHNGNAYYVNRAGVVYCIDAESGETVFNSRIKESTWATPLGVGDRVYFFGQTGDTTVIAAGDEFQELSVNRLWDPPADGGGPGGFNAEIQYGTALVDAGLLIRTGSNLYFIEAIQ